MGVKKNTSGGGEEGSRRTKGYPRRRETIFKSSGVLRRGPGEGDVLGILARKTEGEGPRRKERKARACTEGETRQINLRREIRKSGGVSSLLVRQDSIVSPGPRQ